MTNKKEYWCNYLNNYTNLIYHIIRSTLNNYTNDDINEVYQNIYIKVYSNNCNILENFDENKAQFSTYLSIIVRNVSLDYVKNKNKYKIIEFNEEHSFMSFGEMYDIEGCLEIPKELLSTKEELVIRLFYEKELNNVEIGELLNLSDSTVRVMKKNGLDKLKKYYKENEYV